MGAGKVAPAALMVSAADIAVEVAKANNEAKRICFFMIGSFLSRVGWIAPPLCLTRVWLEVWHSSGQGVPEIKINRVVVRSFWSARGHKPRIAAQPLILPHVDD